MHRRLTITVSDETYRGLHRRVGRGRISQFIEDLVRPHVVDESSPEAAYREMAADRSREQDAREWIEASPHELPD